MLYNELVTSIDTEISKSDQIFERKERRNRRKTKHFVPLTSVESLGDFQDPSSSVKKIFNTSIYDQTIIQEKISELNSSPADATPRSRKKIDSDSPGLKSISDHSE